MDAVIVPHSPEEFRCDLPGWLLERACFVGPIVRQPDPMAQEKLRRKYELAPGDFLLVSTCGGGGFVGQEESFFATVWDVQSRIAPELPNLRHVVVRGPNSHKTLQAPPGVILVDTEPDMVSLLALSDLVIAEGGYNTVNEIRVTHTPAVFLPSPRHRDDQEERVRQLEARGLARVYGAAEHHRVAADVLELCRCPETLTAMRWRYGLERLEIGNRRAAECLAELASWN
jgi:UDP-N-acetylglucosamine:LPS N-acetylglucosamine transferase